MCSDWPTATIAECASNEPYSTQIGPFGEKIKASLYTHEGVPVLRGTNVNPPGRFFDDDFVFIEPTLAAKEFGKFICEADDVILCHKGTLGKIGIIPKRSRFKRYVMGNSMMKVRCDPTKLQPLYLYYWLTSKDGQDYIYSRVSQVGVPQLQRPLTTLREARLPVPPISEQRSIARVLGELDDKIELNRRMNATLEAMAQALFQSWFVEFEPVRAKAEGRAPAGLDAATAALFLAEFSDSDLGEVPAGWQVRTIGDLVSLQMNRVEADESKNSIPYIGLEDMPTKSINLSAFRPGSEVNSSIIAFEEGDVLFGSMRPYFHKVGLAQFDGITRTTTFVLRPSQDEYRHFALMHLFSEAVIDFATAHSVGTTIPYVKWDSLAGYELVVPPLPLLEAFALRMKPLLDQIAANSSESIKLAKARDELLPELLSGRVRVNQ